jgi:uncharacterized membrane protein YdbT with pleckstrin-like domain
MNTDTPIREGTPSLVAAFAVASFGFILFGAITLAVFILPDEIRRWHYIIGGITGALALLMYPWQILDTKTRRLILSQSSVTYRCGILSRFEVEIPYRSIQAVTVCQGIIQRIFGCGDVRVTALGVSGPNIISQRDMNSVCIKSIADFAEVAHILRQKMSGQDSHGREVEGTQ